MTQSSSEHMRAAGYGSPASPDINNKVMDQAIKLSSLDPHDNGRISDIEAQPALWWCMNANSVCIKASGWCCSRSGRYKPVGKSQPVAKQQRNDVAQSIPGSAYEIANNG